MMTLSLPPDKALRIGEEPRQMRSLRGIMGEMARAEDIHVPEIHVRYSPSRGASRRCSRSSKRASHVGSVLASPNHFLVVAECTIWSAQHTASAATVCRPSLSGPIVRRRHSPGTSPSQPWSCCGRTVSSAACSTRRPRGPLPATTAGREAA
jgi:hypothetical protein